MKRFLLIFAFSAAQAFAQGASHSEAHTHSMAGYPQTAADCGGDTVFEPTMGMCMPYPSRAQGMLMLSVNAFGTGSFVGSRRGGTQFASPHMLMLDLGHTVGERQYWNLDVMLTAERWTIPDAGYLLLGQVGESNASGAPYVDAQHPHSSPLMGVTLSDTIALGDRTGRTRLKLSFSPRGSTTEGFVPFMHRPTAAFIPDAPLGHHVGQDVGHIASTVIAAQLGFDAGGDTIVQVSAFNGREPQPTQIDLPLGVPNSAGLRVLHAFLPDVWALGSIGYLTGDDPAGLNRAPVWRTSFGIQGDHRFQGGWRFSETLGWGWISPHDGVPSQSSLLAEGALRLRRAVGWNLFSRLEWVNRTANQLGVTGDTHPNINSAVVLASLGSSVGVSLPGWARGYELALGGMGSLTVMPSDWTAAYGASVLGSIRAFVQLRGMGMVGF